VKNERDKREIDEEKIAKLMKRRDTRSSKMRLELLRKISSKDKKKEPQLIKRDK
jgi:hypothetical protein